MKFEISFKTSHSQRVKCWENSDVPAPLHFCKVKIISLHEAPQFLACHFCLVCTAKITMKSKLKLNILNMAQSWTKLNTGSMTGNQQRKGTNKAHNYYLFTELKCSSSSFKASSKYLHLVQLHCARQRRCFWHLSLGIESACLTWLLECTTHCYTNHASQATLAMCVQVLPEQLGGLAHWRALFSPRATILYLLLAPLQLREVIPFI